MAEAVNGVADGGSDMGDSVVQSVQIRRDRINVLLAAAILVVSGCVAGASPSVSGEEGTCRP
jgi:hypothetical protein